MPVHPRLGRGSQRAWHGQGLGDERSPAFPLFQSLETPAAMGTSKTPAKPLARSSTSSPGTRSKKD